MSEASNHLNLGVMKKYVLTLVVLVFCFGAMAQSFGTLKGKVKTESGEPVPFASVLAYMGENPVGTSTDEDGEFTIKPLQSGIYKIQVTSIGYHDLVITNVTINPDDIRFLNDLVLKENTVIIDGGAEVFTYTDPLIDPEETSKMTMRAVDIEKTPMAKNPVGLIASMSSDIYQKPGTNELYFRGSRPTSVLYMIDGQKSLTGAANFPGGAIGSISVYTGGIPAKYGDTTGGVVVIETKNYFDFYQEKLNEMNR